MSVHITNTDLDDWSRRRDSEGHLPTLVRRLIMASVRPDWIRMPAAEGVALKGLDGVVSVAGACHPYVPVGNSVWELGTNEKRKAKATADYMKRTEDTPADERKNLTYVCVLSRKWGSGDKWVKEMKTLDHGWKDIIVLAADELALWIEGCPGVEAWLLEHLGKASLGDIGIADWFTRWSVQTHPATPEASLTAGRRKDVIRLLNALDAAPTDAFTIAASSVEEAVAFTAAALSIGPVPLPKNPSDKDAAEERKSDSDIRTPEHLEALRERTIVITEEAGWRRWSTHHTAHILIPLFTPDSIGEAIDAGHHVVLPKAARTAHEEGRLQPLDPHKAAEAWQATGLDFYRAYAYARAARRNLGTLRRRLSRHGHQTPAWAAGANAPLLASALLAGAWDADKEGDREVLLSLTRITDWPDLSKTLIPLTTVEDAPLGILGDHWDFVDIVDAWDAIGPLVTPDDIATFTCAISDVLTEIDPQAEFTIEERVRFTFDDRRPRRRYSNSLRRGLTTTLAILGAVIGDSAAAGTLTGQEIATRVVRNLLENADETRWLTLAGELQLLAEAAPDAFLHAVEASLRDESPAIMGLFNERESLLSTQSSHSSLLWALETLAFSPAHVARVAGALARFAVLDPGGTLTNRPAASLVSILNLVRPDGAINAGNRIDVLDAVIAAVPEQTAALIKGLVENRGGGIVNPGPRFRDWSNDRQFASITEYQTTLTELCTRLLTVPATGLVQAAELIGRFSSTDKARVLDMLTARWGELDEGAQAEVLTKVADNAANHRRYSDAAWAMPAADVEALDRFLEAHGFDLETGENEALFTWASDIDEDGRNRSESDKPETSIDARRTDMVRTLLADGGLDKVTAFAAKVEVPGYVGKALADLDTGENLGLTDSVLDLLGDGNIATLQPGSEVARGYALTRSVDFSWLMEQVAKRPNQAAVLLGTVRISNAVLDIVEKLDEPQRATFWKRANPYRLEGDTIKRTCEGLLAAGRPFSAMTAAATREEPGPAADVIIKVLTADLENINEAKPDDYHRLSYTVGRLLNRLELLGTDDETISNLEYYYLPILNGPREPRALHRELARKPELFVTAVTSVYKMDSEPDTDITAALDGTETSGMTDEQLRFSDAAWRLLDGWQGPLPGTTAGSDLPTTEAVQAWVDQVRTKLAACGRSQIAPVVIGEALAAPITDPDGTWPCEAVRNVIEHEQSDDIDAGLHMKRRNQRGVHGRAIYTGGDQERDLAAKYREHAAKVRNRWPRTGAILDSLARSYDSDARREDEGAERDARRD